MSSTAAIDRYSEVAQRAADEVIRSYSTSFGAATRLLGPRHRRHVRNIYAMVRIADELVDGVAQQAGLTPEQQRAALERFVDETHRAMRTGCSADLVVHAFACTARAAGIDESLTVPFFDSMRADLPDPDAVSGVTRYDAEQHEAYVYGSAEVVGLMCLRVFVRDAAPDPARLATLERGARALGAAFQNVNFLRDLADDSARLGRSYLGTTDRLTDADRDRWVATIREQLHDALACIPELPKDARTAVRCAHHLFAALTDRIARTPAEELYRRRVRVPNPVKATLIARAAASTWRERS